MSQRIPEFRPKVVRRDPEFRLGDFLIEAAILFGVGTSIILLMVAVAST